MQDTYKTDVEEELTLFNLSKLESVHIPTHNTFQKTFFACETLLHI